MTVGGCDHRCARFCFQVPGPLSYAVLAAGMGFVHNFTELLVTRILLGLTEAVRDTPPNFACQADLYNRVYSRAFRTFSLCGIDGMRSISVLRCSFRQLPWLVSRIPCGALGTSS